MKSWMSWTLFAAATAAVAYAASDQWVTRSIAFALMTIPVAVGLTRDKPVPEQLE